MIRDRVFFLPAGHGHTDGTALKPRRWFLTQEMREKRLDSVAVEILFHDPYWAVGVPIVYPHHERDVRICRQCFRHAPYHVKHCWRYTEAVGDGWVPTRGVKWLHNPWERQAEVGAAAVVAPYVGRRPKIRWYERLYFRIRRAVAKL